MDGHKSNFRILLINDNAKIHQDFIKILTTSSQAEIVPLAEEKEGNLVRKALPLPSIILPQFKIDSAFNSQEGVQLILKAKEKGLPYALVFVDIDIQQSLSSDVKGTEIIKHIWEVDPEIHIVICTARHEDDSWEKSIAKLEPTDNLLIIQKPVDSVAVRQLAYALTRKWKLGQDSRFYTKSLEQAVEKRTEKLRHQATHDLLTGLPNRVLLLDRIHQAMANYKRHQKGFAVLFCDTDQFKLINDSFGHAAGDELLIMLAKRLKKIIRAFDTLARLGGDEFIIVLTELNSLAAAQEFAHKILQVIKEPFCIADHTIVLTGSIGISLYPQDTHNDNQLLSNADAAMYHAKKLGGDQVQFYSIEMNTKLFEQLEFETELYQALSKKEFSLWYQPQFDIKHHKMQAAEALIRWQHPKKGMVLPLDFISIAERMGLMIPLGEWILREACRQNKRWQEKGLPFLRIAVNIHPQQLRQVNFVSQVKAILAETQLDPKYLELELSERCIINNIAAINMINELKSFGVEIALDDFGTGFSCLHHLRHLSLNRLKIDRSYIDNIQRNHNDEIIINAVITMAHGLNLQVIAEGVETQEQLKFLNAQDCFDIQGFYFSKPLSAPDMEEFLRDFSTTVPSVCNEQ